ncbi:MAG: MoaE-MoaD fusion protein [Solirubrobacteraceae bacterium]|jgi:molybdopterin synthase catalytic subunit/molybdopterin converting factor small subunit|nr:MoaE-MoaD fusion protein [Solirubrobacteraceae bacterium]
MGQSLILDRSYHMYMDVTVRLFAILREQAGAGTLELSLDDGATVHDAIAALRRGPLSGLPEDAPFVVAVGREYAAREQRLLPGDELALVPPVSGGAPDPAALTADPVRLAEVTGEDLDVDAVRRLVADPSTGATVVFVGTTREVPSLEYEAYADMAREQIARLAAATAAEHGLAAVAVAHRTGTVPLGEPSVVVAVSAAHRSEAFAGARALLDAVKAQAPIWKREHPEDGPPAWVAGTLPRT